MSSIAKHIMSWSAQKSMKNVHTLSQTLEALLVILDFFTQMCILVLFVSRNAKLGQLNKLIKQTAIYHSKVLYNQNTENEWTVTMTCLQIQLNTALYTMYCAIQLKLNN